MSDWTWEYVPDAAHVVGGLTPALSVPMLECSCSRPAAGVDLGADRRERGLDFAVGPAAELGQYVCRRRDVLIADDPGEDASRLRADDSCAYSLSGKNTPASSVETFPLAAVFIFHGLESASSPATYRNCAARLPGRPSPDAEADRRLRRRTPPR